MSAPGTEQTLITEMYTCLKGSFPHPAAALFF